jgi:serine/threonine protein kinase
MTLPICTITHRSPDLLEAEASGSTVVYYEGQKLDVWSIGVLIAEICCGADPFGPIISGTSPGRMLGLIRTRVDSVKRLVRDHLYPEQYILFCRCLLEKPVKRPTVEELLAVFTGARRQEPEEPEESEESEESEEPEEPEEQLA